MLHVNSPQIPHTRSTAPEEEQWQFEAQYRPYYSAPQTASDYEAKFIWTYLCMRSAGLTWELVKRWQDIIFRIAEDDVSEHSTATPIPDRRVQGAVLG